MEYGSSMAETLINVINIFYTDRGFIVMVDLLWRLFEKTGSVGSYLLYKAVQRVEGESYLDPSVSSSGEEKKVYQVGKE